MTRELVYLGVTHHTAPLEVRERLRCAADAQRALLDRLGALSAECMVLSTCERFEIYSFAERSSASALIPLLAESLAQFPLWRSEPRASARAAQPGAGMFSAVHGGAALGHATLSGSGSHDHATLPTNRLEDRGLEEGFLRTYLKSLRGEHAAAQLIRVACGLESRIVGEPHILGQVRAAYRMAGESGALGPVLSALGRAAIHAGKRVRHETPINADARSIATITADRMEEDFGSLLDRTVVIVGTGKLASDLALHLAVRRAALIIVSRSADRAAALADKVHGTGVIADRLSEVLAYADGVVTCSSTPGFVITPTLFIHRAPHRLRIWDLSVPRSVDPAVAALPDVYLTHLDDVLVGEMGRHQGVDAAEAVAHMELDRFAQWLSERQFAPRIAAAVQRAFQSASHGLRIDGRALHERILRIKSGAAA